jgi:hypothetical protein
MEKIIETLNEVLQPSEKYIESLNLEIDKLKKIPSVENADVLKRLEISRDSAIVLFLRSFKGTAIDIQLREKRVDKEKKITYIIFWVDRKKYFRVLKEPLIVFFNQFIQLVHQDKTINLVDIKLKEENNILLLIEMEAS